MRSFKATSMARGGPAGAVLLVAGLVTPVVLLTPATAQAPETRSQDPTPSGVKCSVDLTNPGEMKDIVSNALNRGLNQNSTAVRGFLRGAENSYPNGQALLEAAAAHFKIAEADLAAEVERFRHCNCTHVGGELFGRSSEGESSSDAFEVTKFASDVTLHVVLHEMGHALIREFDLPVLGNEETIADAFATHYLTAHLPDLAFDALSARTRSLMIEAGEVPREQWAVNGEHNSDARRAFQIAALAVAADPQKYRAIAIDVGMTDRDIQRATDYGAEIHRSWRRTLAPLWMPEGMKSKEARLAFDSDDGFAGEMRSSELAGVLAGAIRRFDWHSQVKIRFVNGEGGAGWSRSKRTVTVHSEYVRRFVVQGLLRDEDDGGLDRDPGR